MEAVTIETDVLIIGAGMAGCRAAIEARDRGARVLLTTKGLFGMDAAASWQAGAGYQCWGISPHDTLDVQVEDTIRCGWFLNNQKNVYAFLAHFPDTARDLLRWGGRYRMKDDQLWPIWQLGCSIPEGRSITPPRWPHTKHGYIQQLTLPRAVRKKKADIIENVFIADLLTRGDTVVGALGIDISTGRFMVLKAKATILATGGYQGLYRISTASPNLTGDGQAAALRAGADMMDFEFNQTLPAALWPPELAGSIVPFHLIMDWGGRMYNSDNERFLSKWDPEKMEHSTRAVLSRAIFHEIKAGKMSPHGGIYVKVDHHPPEFIREKFRQEGRSRDVLKLRKAGIDLTREGIETAYVIHYCQGGCAVNADCETDKPGLYAAGEAAAGSKDGSDRMMSNALPYCMAMGIIAGRGAAQRAKTIDTPEMDGTQVEMLQRRAGKPLDRDKGLRVYKVKPQFQDTIYQKIGYGRTEENLEAALVEVERYKDEVLNELWVPNKDKPFNQEWINALEFKNLVLMAECIIRNALVRTESRGLHDRIDYPAPDANWFKNIHLRLADGVLQQWTTPVEFTYWRPEPGSLGEPWHRGFQENEYEGWRAEPLYEDTGL